MLLRCESTKGVYNCIGGVKQRKRTCRVLSLGRLESAGMSVFAAIFVKGSEAVRLGKQVIAPEKCGLWVGSRRVVLTKVKVKSNSMVARRIERLVRRTSYLVKTRQVVADTRRVHDVGKLDVHRYREGGEGRKIFIGRCHARRVMSCVGRRGRRDGVKVLLSKSAKFCDNTGGLGRQLARMYSRRVRVCSKVSSLSCLTSGINIS